VLNPGLTDLPPVDVEEHVTVDHAAFPADPGRALLWGAGLQRVLERQVPGTVVVADDTAEPLTLARGDAVNAEMLFFLLGIPGVLVAAALGLAAESALAAAHRREDGLMRLRGATERQLATVTSAHAVLAGIAGGALGLVAAALAVSAVDGSPVWRDVPAGRAAVTVALGMLTAVAIVAVRVLRLVRDGRRTDVVTDTAAARTWSPTGSCSTGAGPRRGAAPASISWRSVRGPRSWRWTWCPADCARVLRSRASRWPCRSTCSSRRCCSGPAPRCSSSGR
jgi:putative ABC transport system permease protein